MNTECQEGYANKKIFQMQLTNLSNANENYTVLDMYN